MLLHSHATHHILETLHAWHLGHSLHLDHAWLLLHHVWVSLLSWRRGLRFSLVLLVVIELGNFVLVAFALQLLPHNTNNSTATNQTDNGPDCSTSCLATSSLYGIDLKSKIGGSAPVALIVPINTSFTNWLFISSAALKLDQFWVSASPEKNPSVVPPVTVIF